ncbi:MAG TPA: CPBP family intramembrane glutamic endopeptidase [Blastocatellia bacterium]|nr:CPBP family intramembrane glutamic endopeptidase [Blastocatellia bacterium]
MSISTVFINPEKRRLRSGWRVAIFFLLSPLVLQALATLISKGVQSDSSPTSSRFSVSFGAILEYAVLVGWVILSSWFCLRKLDHLSLKALGLGFYRGWWRELLVGAGFGALMIVAVVALQMIGGGTRLMISPMMWKSVETGRAIDVVGVGMVFGSIGFLLVFLSLAGLLEELLFRGYPFQTLLRDIPPFVPMVILAMAFGLMHWDNPSRTLFSTANTILAGIWLAVAYLKTRALWFPTALHFMWNWMMGAFFGIPVSGLKIVRYPIFLAANEEPLWLTGGSYGCEGGVAATVILIVATLTIWKANWLRVAPEMQAALTPRETSNSETIKLNLVE